jgi:hypothetical protein
MSRQSQAKDELFLRYRNGGQIFAKSDIKQVIRSLLPDLRSNSDHNAALIQHIRNIADGSGAGIHPDSTWPQALRELFHRYERYSNEPIAPNTKQAIFHILEMLCKGNGNTRLNWDEIRNYIIEHIEDLAPTYPGRFLTIEGYEVQRNEQGEYYYIDNGQTIYIQGLKTPAEEKFAFYTNDAQNGYGRLYALLRFIALFDIAYEYRHHRNNFPDKLACTLYDNSGSDTSYLAWDWRMPTPFEYVPFQWRPRSQFSDPGWLSSDLIMHMPFASEPESTTIVPVLPEDDAASKWREAFNGFSWQVEIPVISNVLLGDEREVYFDFMDRKVRWINGNAFLQPLIVVPASSPDGNDGIEVARKFLSVLNMTHEIKLSERLISVQQIRYLPYFKDLRMPVFQMIDPDYVLPFDDVSTYSQKKWFALAFLREATSSNSVYYAFLNYYKIIELARNGNADRVKRWINNNVEQVCTNAGISWYADFIASGETDPGLYLHKTERVAIAHSDYRFNGSRNTHNPDSPEDYNRTQNDLAAIRALAKNILPTIN